MQFRNSKFFRLISAPLFILSLVCIVTTLRNKFHEFPPKWADIFLFCFAVAGVAFILYRAGTGLLRDEAKAGVLSSFLLIFLLFYFDIFHSFFGLKVLYSFVYTYLFQKFHVVLLLLILVFTGLLFFMLKRTKRNISSVNLFLRLFFLSLLVFETSRVYFSGTFEVKLQDELSSASDVKPAAPKRDIYYIVMDSYTSSSSLKKYWNYDNHELSDFLVSKGFFIAGKSRSNYNSTLFSLLSSLTLSYINVENYHQAQHVPVSKTFDMVKNSTVIKTLIDNGYEIKNLSLFDLPGSPAYYKDPYYHQSGLFKRTIFHLLFEKLHVSGQQKLFGALREINVEIIKNIPVKKNDKPVFCYAHPMFPHEPFFFDEAGDEMPDNYALNSEEKEKKYLKQLQFANKLLIRTIETILDSSTVKPIILLQGDHGFRYLEKVGYEERVAESFTILNAYYFPEDSLKTDVYDSISPVNSFRILFNEYFGTALPLLEDRSFNTEIKPDK